MIFNIIILFSLIMSIAAIFIAQMILPPKVHAEEITIYDPQTGNIMKGEIDCDGKGRVFNSDSGDFIEIEIKDDNTAIIHDIQTDSYYESDIGEE